MEEALEKLKFVPEGKLSRFIKISWIDSIP